MNRTKLTGVAKQATLVSCTAQKFAGHFWVELEAKAIDGCNSANNTWVFESQPDAINFLLDLECAVGTAIESIRDVDHAATSSPAEPTTEHLAALDCPERDATERVTDVDCDEDWPAAMQMEAGFNESEGHFVTVFVYDQVGGLSSRGLTFDSEAEVLAFLKSVNDSVVVAGDSIHFARQRVNIEHLQNARTSFAGSAETGSPPDLVTGDATRR